MKNVILSIIIGATIFTAAPAAVANGILQKGDFITQVDDRSLQIHQVRALLRDRGYSSFGRGDNHGRQITISAYAPDKKRYRLVIDRQTGEIDSAIRIYTF